jgi:hypothetical protein
MKIMQTSVSVMHPVVGFVSQLVLAFRFGTVLSRRLEPKQARKMKWTPPSNPAHRKETMDGKSVVSAVQIGCTTIGRVTH